MINIEELKERAAAHSARSKRIMKIITTMNLGLWTALPPLLFVLIMGLIGGADLPEPLFRWAILYTVPFTMFMGYWNGLFVQWACKFWSTR